MAGITHPSVRPLSGELDHWRDILSAHYQRLGSHSRRLRFLCGASDDGVRRIARNATPERVIGIEIDGKTRGVLEIFRTSHVRGEIGISVEDAYQGQGYGRKLFAAGLKEADLLGISTAVVVFDPANNGVRKLIKAAGGRFTHHPGHEVQATVDVKSAISSDRTD